MHKAIKYIITENINPLSAKCIIFYHKNTSVHMSESETTNASNWKVIREGEAGKKSLSIWTLDQFLALKGLRQFNLESLCFDLFCLHLLPFCRNY